ncbi:hypothetical protein LJR225_000431 [Phenylobacterium sp. LjRoot225]|uniref:hypothetical protein n=1 Tax=Phenylobacterium sp. LjRoot225 TaxID=3342285 RepID=UPI003ECCDBF9
MAAKGLILLRDLVAIVLTAVGFGFVMAMGLNSIVAGAAVPMALGYALIIAFPMAMLARAYEHHGVLMAAAWGAGAGVLPGLFALTGSLWGLPLVIGVGALGGVVAWIVVQFQAAIASRLPVRLKVPAGYALTLGIGAAIIAGLGLKLQPGQVVRPVAAIEAPISTAADRADLVKLLTKEAAADGGLHVDDATERWASLYAANKRDGHPLPPEIRATIDIGIWRGSRDDDLEASADDRGHLGRVWIVFFEGEQPEKSAKARAGILAAVRGRWPEARDIPLMPNGELPSAGDLVWMGRAYTVKPERLASYSGSQP